MTADTSTTSLCANIWCYFNFCSPTKFPDNLSKKCERENNDQKYILFQYISGMATGGQASNVSYSSVSQSSDGGICATGSGPSSGGMWRHTSARPGPRRERAIRFRDAWLVTWSRLRRIDLQETRRIFLRNLILLRLKNVTRTCFEKVLWTVQFIATRRLCEMKNRNVLWVDGIETAWRVNIDREISEAAKHVLNTYWTFAMAFKLPRFNLKRVVGLSFL